jgi:hypothetical protein
MLLRHRRRRQKEEIQVAEAPAEAPAEAQAVQEDDEAAVVKEATLIRGAPHPRPVLRTLRTIR